MNGIKWLGYLWIAATTLPISARNADVILMLDAKRETAACLVVLHQDRPANPLPNCTSADLPKLFLTQGERAELRVYNRRFLTDYTITVDAVTPLTGAAIRNLEEAENLSLGSPSFVTPPPAKGGFETISQRTAGDILALLMDETQATKPVADLNADFDELSREYTQVTRDVAAFQQNYEDLTGKPRHPPECQKISGAPDAHSLLSCIGGELQREDVEFPPGQIYTNEQEFREAIVRVQELIVALKTYSDVIASTKIIQLAQQLDFEVTQYEKNYITFYQNLVSAQDAANLLEHMSEAQGDRTSLRTDLRTAQIRALLSKTVKVPPDEAEINELARKYKELLKQRGDELARHRAAELDSRATFIGAYCLQGPSGKSCDGNSVQPPREPNGVSEKANKAKYLVAVELPRLLDNINAEQGTLLTRMNEIYDHSAVPDALPRQIDFSDHKGNLVVYYTIRRIDTFARFRVVQVQSAGETVAPSTSGAALPPATAGTPASTASATSATPQTSSSTSGTTSNTGAVVTRGAFYVHDFYRANVLAAFAYSWAKDQTIVKQPEPTACTGSAASPDNNCFSPFLNGTSPQLNLILGVDYYFHRRDTFYDVAGQLTATPKRSTREWLLQSTGIMGAISATKANNWFIGTFFEPVLGVQLGVGANFTSETHLQQNFQFGIPVDITEDFPTQQVRVTKPFISAGLDLGLFRKIFGKVTGIGVSTSSTQGK